MGIFYLRAQRAGVPMSIQLQCKRSPNSALQLKVHHAHHSRVHHASFEGCSGKLRLSSRLTKAQPLLKVSMLLQREKDDAASASVQPICEACCSGQRQEACAVLCQRGWRN